MPDQQDKDFNEMSWSQKFEIIRAISLFFAVSVIVFTRRKLGFRMMNPIVLLGLLIALEVLDAVFYEAAGPRASLLAYFAVAMFAAGMFHRWQRWKDLCNGVRWHTYSHGVSWLEYLPWPVFIRSHYRLTRYVEPLAVMIVGVLIGLVSHALGIWIMWSAIFLFVFEGDWYEKGLARHLDMLDGLIDAEVQMENVKHFEQPQPEQRQRTLEDTAGVATDISPDIEKQVALRKAKRRAAAPDNLATGVAESPA